MKIVEEIKKKSSIDLTYESIKDESLEIIKLNNKSSIKSNKKFKLVISSVFASLLIIASIITLVVVTTNKKFDSKAEEINNSINNLSSIEDDEKRMLEILNIDNEIKLLNEEEKTNIKIDELRKESTRTSNILKNSVEWKDEISYEKDYYSINEILNLDEVTSIECTQPLLSFPYPLDIDSIDLLNFLDVPYFKIKGLNSDFFEKYLKPDIIDDTNIAKRFIIIHMR